MIRKHLGTRATAGDIDYGQASVLTEGYSGADIGKIHKPCLTTATFRLLYIELVCREAAMMPIRRLMNKFQEQGFQEAPSLIPIPPPTQKVNSATPSAAAAISVLKYNNTTASKSFLQMQMTASEVDSYLKEDPIQNADIVKALQTTKPSSDGNIAKYMAWQKEFGNT